MRRLALLAVLVSALAAPAGALAAASPSPRTSLIDLEDEVMCVTCNVALNIAESPQADRQRAFIRAQVDQGKDKDQVKAALVAEYGADVLALPDDDGFGVTAYAVPLALGGLLIAGLALLVPRWRWRGADADGADGAPKAPPPAALSPTDTRRLDEDLARYDR